MAVYAHFGRVNFSISGEMTSPFGVFPEKPEDVLADVYLMHNRCGWDSNYALYALVCVCERTTVVCLAELK